MRSEMNMRVVLYAAAAMLMSEGTAAAAPAGSTVLYESDGFSGFTVDAALAGQDGWVDTGGANTTAVVVDDAPGAAGNAVEVFRAANEVGNWYVPNITPPAGSGDVVVVEWNQYVQGTGVSFPYGPFFGIEMYNDDAPDLTRLAALYVDASDGSLWSLDSNDGTTTSAGSSVALNQWNPFKIELDFGATSDHVSIYANNNLVYTDDFSDFHSGDGDYDFSTFTDATIRTLQGNADVDSEAQTGTAYFDDYMVYAVPEPATATMLAGMVLVLMRQRRRRDTAA